MDDQKVIQEREPDAKVLEGLPLSGSDAGTDDAEQEILNWLKGLNIK